MERQRRLVRVGWLARVALALCGGMFLLVVIAVVVFEATRTDTIDPDELRSTLADVLADAPPNQRSGVTVDERSCDIGDGSPGLYSSATEVWTVPLGGQAEALDRIEERAVALGYQEMAVGAVLDERPLSSFWSGDQPSVLEVHARDTPTGIEVVVSVYDTCFP